MKCKACNGTGEYVCPSCHNDNSICKECRKDLGHFECSACEGTGEFDDNILLR